MTFTADGKRTAKVNSNFLFFSCNPYVNQTKIKKSLLPVTANANTLILLHRELKTDDKSFIFCRLPFAVNEVSEICRILHILRKPNSVIANC